MFNKIKNVCKGAKRFVDKKIEACKDILSSSQNRITVGLLVIGAGIGIVAVGGGLIASAYIHAPA